MNEFEKIDDRQHDLKANAMGEQAGMHAMNQDFELEQALNDFKNSVHAWSDAAYTRPRSLGREVRHRSWKMALGWALGCVLVAGSVSGGLLEQRHLKHVAQTAAAQHELDRQKQLRELQASRETDEALLAGVDSDVSRQVPSALEPLAQMSDDEAK